jgi:acyl-CoA synthetase (NDP forming)
MNSEEQLIKQLDALFHPRSVAVVGVPRGMKTGKLFLIALVDQGFPGKIYPVHPSAREIDGLKTYPNVSAIPDSVDLAIVLVPHHEAMEVVRECAVKGVKGTVLFTAGYKETGTVEGKKEEEELARLAKSSGMRIIGPNCMGFYSPESGLSFFPELSREPGPVGLISHSGSLANVLGRIASQKGIRFSKVISLGNECDLTSADFLLYLGKDASTGLIGAYLEGIRDGPYFLRALKEASLQKPVILWKVGLNDQGSKAAASHTGALAGSKESWTGAARQGGAICVEGFEPFIDALMGFSLLPPNLGDRMAIISGPGGFAVAAAEACGREGLRLAKLSPETQSTLRAFVPPTGTSVRNPVDVGLSASLEIEIYVESARAAAADSGVDAVMVVGTGLTPETNRRYTEYLIQVRNESKKPFLMINIPGFDPELIKVFYQAGVPFFETSERAARTYAHALEYKKWCAMRANAGQDLVE